MSQPTKQSGGVTVPVLLLALACAAHSDAPLPTPTPVSPKSTPTGSGHAQRSPYGEQDYPPGTPLPTPEPAPPGCGKPDLSSLGTNGAAPGTTSAPPKKDKKSPKTQTTPNCAQRSTPTSSAQR